jgi:hypothetical protein
MIPKLKAKELYEKMLFCYQGHIDLYTDRQCALIAVDEMIIQNGELYLNGLDGDYYKEKNSFLFAVKQEIENL